MLEQCRKSVKCIEKKAGKLFGVSDSNVCMVPLLLAVRLSPTITDLFTTSGSVLGIGMNNEIVEVMARVSQNPHWAYDTYRRFIQMYGVAVLRIDHRVFDDILTRARVACGVSENSVLKEDALKSVIAEFKELGRIPRDPWQQLSEVVSAVFDSWCSTSASQYRTQRGIRSDLPTAIIVQEMVHGNMNERSGCGVAVSRNPVTGSRECCGRYQTNTASEELLRGEQSLSGSLSALQEQQPAVYEELLRVLQTLEKHFKVTQVNT